MSTRQGSLIVTVDTGGDDPAVADELILGLCDELRLLEIDSVRRAPAGEVPPGARAATADSITSLIVSGLFSAGTLGALTRVLVEWIRRSGARRVVLEEDGDRLELDALSRPEQQELIRAWLSRHTATPDA